MPVLDGRNVTLSELGHGGLMVVVANCAGTSCPDLRSDYLRPGGQFKDLGGIYMDWCPVCSEEMEYDKKDNRLVCRIAGIK